MTLEEAKNLMEHMRQRKIERAAQARGDAERFRAVEPAQETILRANYVRQLAERSDRYAEAIEQELDAIRIIMNFVESMGVKN